ncbi:putative Histidine kinase [Candidatus Zixiibacteriota bacterium]|nr:putative Histidine kinase [candidate division Zixibacteria bacterium]
MAPIHTPEEFNDLGRHILRYATRGILRAEFLRQVSQMILDFSGCDCLEMRLKERGRHFRTELTLNNPDSFRFEVLAGKEDQPSRFFPRENFDSDYEKLCYKVLSGLHTGSGPGVTPRGSLRISDTDAGLTIQSPNHSPEKLSLSGEFRTLAIIPFAIDGVNNCLLVLKSRTPDYLSVDEVAKFEGVAQNLGVALVHRHAQIAVRERVKELTCLYGISKMVLRPGVTLEQILQTVVELLPPAWLYPETATARVTIDGKSYLAPQFDETPWKLSADVTVNNIKRGKVEILYREERPLLDEGVFLQEERNLIDTVAGEIAVIIERREAESEKKRLQEQLLHADRLATIGQLAAGVAHELNEPLGTILGFAQLARKNQGMPEPADQDLQKIINASLHAREVIKKLMVFARQMPPTKVTVNLNRVVDDGLYFLESRCASAGIEMIRKTAPDLPEIVADPSQLHQVLVNLVVNSIQAMPRGGRLIIETGADQNFVYLIIEDSGIGMNEETLKKIFIPFFTTKDVHEGTGLGLSVVHGIVSAHGGSIKVQSREGAGSRFEVQLPIHISNNKKESDDHA